MVALVVMVVEVARVIIMVIVVIVTVHEIINIVLLLYEIDVSLLSLSNRRAHVGNIAALNTTPGTCHRQMSVEVQADK